MRCAWHGHTLTCVCTEQVAVSARESIGYCENPNKNCSIKERAKNQSMGNESGGYAPDPFTSIAALVECIA